MRDEQPSARDPEVAVTVPRNALKKWQKVREFALGMPGAVEQARAQALGWPGAGPARYGPAGQGGCAPLPEGRAHRPRSRCATGSRRVAT